MTHSRRENVGSLAYFLFARYVHLDLLTVFFSPILMSMIILHTSYHRLILQLGL